MKGAPAASSPFKEDRGSADAPLIVDRYAIYDAIASGGMATVHLGRLIGNAGFLRTVAIKRLHAQFAHDADFTAMFLDEARLASRIQHPNVVSTLDVVMKEDELLLVMEYIRGESLSRLIRRARISNERLPPRVVVAIIAGALHGLHAAHEALDEKGRPLGLVHRDMSPQNVLVGTDGVARVLDFGVAKAAGRVHTTKDGDIKGKVLYMSPEQLAAQPLNCTADVYAAGVVLFETLTCVRMFAGENEVAAITKIIQNEIRVPSEIDPALAPFDDIVRRATAADPKDRYVSALAMAIDLEAEGGSPASPAEVSAWVQKLAGEVLDERARMVAEIERSSTRSKPPLAGPDSPPSSVLSGVVRSPLPTLAEATLTTALALPESAVVPRGVGAETRSFKTAGLAVLSALLAIACIAIIMLLMRRPEPTPTVDPVANANEPAPVVTAAVLVRPAASVIASAVAPAPSVTATPTASATTGPTVTATAAAVTTAAAATAPRATAAAARVNCDPPWVLDKNGHQHFLPECMK